jgi:hypothetical protein
MSKNNAQLGCYVRPWDAHAPNVPTSRARRARPRSPRLGRPQIPNASARNPPRLPPAPPHFSSFFWLHRDARAARPQPEREKDEHPPLTISHPSPHARRLRLRRPQDLGRSGGRRLPRFALQTLPLPSLAAPPHPISSFWPPRGGSEPAAPQGGQPRQFPPRFGFLFLRVELDPRC